jgi:hypothetical protein
MEGGQHEGQQSQEREALIGGVPRRPRRPAAQRRSR